MGLQGNEEDVRFDWAAAERLEGSLRALAARLGEQAPSRSAWATDALQEFRGRYADAFRRNAGTAARDSAEFAAALRDAADKVAELARLAREEQRNREAARAWYRERESRNVGEKVVDWFTGEDPPPPPARSGPRAGVQLVSPAQRGH